MPTIEGREGPLRYFFEYIVHVHVSICQLCLSIRKHNTYYVL